MSAIHTPPAPVAVPTPPERPITVEDLAHFPSELPSGPVRYELDDGRLVIMPPPANEHGAAQSKIAAALVYLGEYRGHGKTRTEVSVILGRNPDRVRVPDAFFVTNARLPLRLSPQRYFETIPELIVEVRSPNDTLAELERKAGEYLSAGSVVVWVVNPQTGEVIEYRKDTPPRIFTDADTLTVDDLIPGFSLTVRDALAE